MKRGLLILIALTAALTAGARVFTETVKTPLGLEIEIVGVHDRLPNLPSHVGDWECDGSRYSHQSYDHGNLTIRFKVNNPTAEPQPLTVEMPLVMGYGWRLWKDVRRPRILFSRLVPPGRDRLVDCSLPHVGAMRQFWNVRDWRFTDGSGKSVDAECLRVNCSPFEFRMPSEMAHFTCAASPSFRFEADFPKRFEKERVKRPDKSSYGLRVNRPAFSRFSDWRDLACYDALLLTTNDLKALSQEFREIVRDYEAVGGKVILADTDANIGIVPFCKDLFAAQKALGGYGEAISFKSDVEAKAFVETVRHETPFAGIILVLLLFAIVAGPVTIAILAKRGRRIHLLWVFPAVAIVFSIAVALVIVFANGLDVKETAFSCEVDRSDLGRRVIVRNRVFVAPFPMCEPIRCPASALVTVDSGADDVAGDWMISTEGGLDIVGHWTPCLWPVRVRTVEVVRTGGEAAE